MMKKNKVQSLMLGLCMFGSSLAFADENTISKAESLIKAHEYKAAYELLEPIESDHSGDRNYDYLLGLSSLETGHPTRAIFALERVLAQNPNDMQARALIARAYYSAGETENAKNELKNLATQDTSKEFSKVIQDNLQAIDKATGQATSFNAYLDFALGHDSNVNSATSNNSVNVVGLGTVLLTANSKELSSSFANAGAGISFKTPIHSKELSLYGSFSDVNRFNFSNEQFNNDLKNYSLGLNYKKFIDNFSVAIDGNSFAVDTQTFRRAIGLMGQWRRDVDDTNQVSIFANTYKLEYPGNSTRDGHRYTVGAGWGHAFSGDKSPVVFLNGYLGKENANDNNLSNDIYGARLGGQLSLNYKWVAYAGAGYEQRDYDGPTLGFSGDRKDKQYDLTLGLRFAPLPSITVKPQIAYINNDSNTPLVDFDRTIISVDFKKEFNW